MIRMIWDEFIWDVENNPENYCTAIKNSVNRFRNDLIKSEDPEWPYFFDELSARFCIRIIKTLRHTKGSWKGKNFNLTKWQGFYLANKYGWKLKSDPTLRRFSKSYLQTARKSGKSELAAAEGIFMTYFLNEGSPQTIIGATKAEQANFIMEPMREMCIMLSQESAIFRSICDIRQYKILNVKDGGYIKKIPADSTKEDGFDVFCGIIDEYHGHTTSGLLKVLETGVVARESPMISIYTTPGHNINSPCYSEYQTVKSILSGDVINDSYFGMIFEMDPENRDKWHDQKLWIHPNPNIGDTPKWKPIQDLYSNAITEGATAEVEFKTKNLGMWVDSPNVFITRNKIIERSTQWKIESLKGRSCYAGLDLSKTEDITALVLLFPPVLEGEAFKAYFRFWVPHSKLEGVKFVDNVDYREWHKSGLLTTTPDNIIDYAFVEDEILNLHRDYNIKSLAYDPWNSDKIIPNLQAAGIECQVCRQGYPDFTAPIKKMEQMFNTVKKHEQLDINNNPIFLWHMSNVVIKMGATGGRMFDKSKGSNKIDGAVACAMAIGEYMTDNPAPDISLEDVLNI